MEKAFEALYDVLYKKFVEDSISFYAGTVLREYCGEQGIDTELLFRNVKIKAQELNILLEESSRPQIPAESPALEIHIAKLLGEIFQSRPR